MDCITFTDNGEEDDRQRLRAPATDTDQAHLTAWKTGRVMVKDEDVCLHCGCAPSAARPAPGT